MKIKEVRARIILDSRKEKTIEVYVNHFNSSSPYGASRGKHEKLPYVKNIKHDVDFLNQINVLGLPEINEFRDLEEIEELFASKLGANSMFAFEASILKALAHDKGKEVWQIINPQLNIKEAKFPRLLSNTIGGGAHSKNKIKPDFQEFLVTCNKNPRLCELVNKRAYYNAKAILSNLTTNNMEINDENAWRTDLDNERVLEIMKNIQENVFEEANTHLDIGLDIAASQFFNKGKYCYNNRKKILTREEQIDYIVKLAEKYNLFYIEDPLDEEDFEGFKKLVSEVNCLIVGDDLTTTNLERVEKAIKMKAITGLIVKPNQIGSLIEVKRVIELCQKNCVKIIVSHRSGETMENFIADLSFAFQADFIKTPVIGKEREIKVNRLKQIENSK